MKPPSKNRVITLPLGWFKQLFSRLGIRQKIAYGYALTIGIAILGSTTGKVLENYYQDQAKKQLAESQKIISLLNNLQAAVLQAQTQTPKLIPLLREPVRLELEYSRLLEYIAAVNRLLYQTNSFLESSELQDRDSPKQVNDSKEIKRSIQAYIDSIKDYSQRLETIDKEFQPSNLKTEKVQSDLLANISYKSSKVEMEINKLSREMSNIVTEIQEKEAQKTLQDLDKASAVGNLVLIISLLSAVAIAAALAIYTSRVIAYPIEVTTKIARQVTKESNFTLQAPVLTEDEVGLLTTSLNELIQRVAEYTQELQQAQTQLIQTEKMSSLGQMIAGIAHEINNPISFIYGNVEHTKNYVEELLGLVHLYQQKYPKPHEEILERIDDIELEFIAEDLPKTLTSMKMGADRIRQLVLSLRNFSRLDEAEVKNVDLHEGIDSTLLILNNRLKDNIEVIKQYGNLPLVECYPAQINQVFMNILNNAIDALLEQAEQPNKQIAIETEQIAPDKVQVRIRDNGSGIAPELQKKIFDPFFTTKKVGKGTGLGLSISYQILEKHGGQIRCNSRLGEETELSVELPVKQPISS
ncbi:sensor histidine kinase [Argonema galeatum]|uniref:sensor histidine kinase n=1 Tax=Argonema galeatum TaxID=2942762 RepID=UPI0020130597|nr:ATP-binding protein [Argonema galeatum]MCL1468077.1 GHKL domain-containing protein [Argonema galeatum A003/A1]